MKLRLASGKTVVILELTDTPTAKALLTAAPFESRAQTWGEEVYFTTPVSAKLEPDARQVVEPGTVCFWTQGDALALPYGRTPISTDARPKLANPCNVVGKLIGDPKVLAKVKSGDAVKVERPEMQRKRVNSSKLRSVGYDEGTRTLEVEMSNGQVYQYVGVYPEVYRRFMAAPNPTSFFDDKIAEEYTPKPVK
jgi:hypothetical protein